MYSPHSTCMYLYYDVPLLICKLIKEKVKRTRTKGWWELEW